MTYNYLGWNFSCSKEVDYNMNLHTFLKKNKKETLLSEVQKEMLLKLW